MSRIRAIVLGASFAILCVVMASGLQAQAPDNGGGGGGRGGRGGQGGPGGGGFGGFGGFGGGPGGGFARSNFSLINNPAVQEEIQFTELQKTQLAAAQKSLDDERTASRAAMRESMKNGVPPDPGAFQAQMASRRQSEDSVVAKVASPKQRKRVTQISLQQEGLPAVVRPDVSAALNLSPDQITSVQDVLDQVTQERRNQMQARREQMQTLFAGILPQGGRGGFGGPGGPGAAGGPGGAGGAGAAGGAGGRGFGRGGQGGNGANAGGNNANANANGGNGNNANAITNGGNGNGNGGNGNNANAGANGANGANGGNGGNGGNGNNANGGNGNRNRNFDRAAFQARMETPEVKSAMEKMQKQTEALNKLRDQKITRILTKKQAQAFTKMQGEPFDLALLNPPRNGGPGGDQTKDATKNAASANSTPSTSTQANTAAASSKSTKAAAKTKSTEPATPAPTGRRTRNLRGTPAPKPSQ